MIKSIGHIAALGVFNKTCRIGAVALTLYLGGETLLLKGPAIHVWIKNQNWTILNTDPRNPLDVGACGI